jgi:hypothetical protein
MKDRLKAVSIVELEQIIAQAIADRIGEQISCSIEELDFSEAMFVKAKITLAEIVDFGGADDEAG